MAVPAQVPPLPTSTLLFGRLNLVTSPGTGNRPLRPIGIAEHVCQVVNGRQVIIDKAFMV